VLRTGHEVTLGADGRVESVVSVARDMSAARRADGERQALYRELIERETRLQEMVKEILLSQQSRSREAGSARMLQLTQREREIVRLLADGQTNQQIGRALGLTAGTVRNHISRLLPKLGASDRTQAAINALQWGILD
jgi:DNA-binding NarL/FixJ family response regulator